MCVKWKVRIDSVFNFHTLHCSEYLPMVVFRNRFLYGFMVVYIYIYIYIYMRVASRNRTLGTLKRNELFAISVYLHAFCTILQSLVALGTSVTKK